MRPILFAMTIAMLLQSISASHSQTVTPSYEVATWPQFRKAAVSYTFDDNCPNQLALAVPMFSNYGFTLTLFTVTNWSLNWTGLQTAAAKGHEIANHTASHPNLGTLAVDQQMAEISNASDAINSHITGQRCITLAYPYCGEGSDTLCERYFVAARGCQGFTEQRTPGNFMNVSSVICGSLGPVKTAQDFKTRADGAASSHGWLVYLIHGIDNDGGYSPLSSDTLRASLEYLNANRETFWVATFGGVARYIKERNCVSVHEVSNQDSTIKVQVTDTLDNRIYDIPLTIRRPLPKKWSSGTVSQNGLPIRSSIVEVDSIEYIMFEVVPDGGEIELKRSAITGMNSLGEDKKKQ